MSFIQPQKNIFYKTLSVFFVVGFLLFSFTLHSRIIKAAPMQSLIEPVDNVIDIKSMQTLDSAKVIGIEEQSEIKIMDMKVVESEESEEVSIITSASAGSVSDNIIAYLVSQQNADGSWGNNTKTQFINTIAVLEAFQAYGITGATTDKGIAWISTYFADNNDYMAQKLNVLIPAGEPASVAETLVYDQDASLGGFPFDSDYEVDPLTTARVIQALSAADYKDPGADQNYTQSLALKYLINKKRFDNGWSVFEGGVSTIPVSSEVIEALLLWRHRTLGTTIKVDDTLDPAVATLSSAQMSNGAWGNDILNTALAYHAIKAAGAMPTYDLETLEYFKSEQEVNGSFNNDIYKTAKVLKAFSVSKSKGQLFVSNIISETTLQTGSVAEFNLLVSNSGNMAVDSGKIHIMADDFLFKSFDLASNNVVVNANSTLDIKIGITNTRNLQGNVRFKIFIQDADGAVYPNSYYKKTLTFLVDSENRPALPMYYVAYKDVSDGTPAITWRWPAKSDPNLNKYVIMLRELGATTWSSANLSYPTTGITVGSLIPDQIYEATFGTSSSSGNIYFFTPPVQIKTSASPSAYIAGTVSGKVRAIEGTIRGVKVIGVNTATNVIPAPPTQDNGTTAGGIPNGIIYNENGEFTQNNVPWGSGYVRILNFRFENFISKYTNANTNLTNVDVFTNLKPDTQNPTVSNVLIVGESDKMIENGQKKLIQYTVGDDIGTGGGIVQSAIFYYYDPHDLEWHIIGREEGLLSGIRNYEWDIPTTLVGAGYKIKVIARDFAEKDSMPTEWGDTFEIISSISLTSETPPTVSDHNTSSTSQATPTPEIPLRFIPITQDNGTTADTINIPATVDNGTTAGTILP